MRPKHYHYLMLATYILKGIELPALNSSVSMPPPVSLRPPRAKGPGADVWGKPPGILVGRIMGLLHHWLSVASGCAIE